MAIRSDSRLSFRRAAELIYRTSTPTPEQIQRVGELVAMAELRGDSRGTTAEAVAEFVSRVALQRQGALDPEQQPRGYGTHPRMQKVYRESLKQYVLAVILRRKIHNASRAFQRAVLGGQAVLLLAVAALVLWSFRAIFPPTAMEHAAVIAWLDQNTDKYRIIEFHPTIHDEDGNARLWVEYHYATPQGRSVDTRRIFTIAGGRVISVDAEE